MILFLGRVGDMVRLQDRRAVVDTRWIAVMRDGDQ
jgi:hypothetical protein